MTNTPVRQPRVLVPACHRNLAGFPSVTVGQKYLDAVILAGAQPWVMPGPAQQPTDNDLADMLDVVDGVLLTGSPSNLHPSHYGEAVLDEALPQDRERDAWVLPLVRLALQRGQPVFGICRGFQEINVALGGTLHQAVHAVPGLADHREPDSADIARRYAPAHSVQVQPGGLLDGLLQGLMQQQRIEVNSLHGQGVARLAPGLRVEALAPDGLVEAYAAKDAAGFLLAVQWHPEWQAASNPVSQALLRAFGMACQAWRDNRVRPPDHQRPAPPNRP